MPPRPPSPPFPDGPKAQWREAQRLRLAGACLYASAVLVATCGSAAFLLAAVSSAMASTPKFSFSLSAALWSSLLSPRVAVAALLMSAAQALAVLATGNAARACPPLAPKALSFVPLLFSGRQSRQRRRWLPSALSATLSAADAALTRLFLDGAASRRACLALVTACAVSGWAIVPLFCWMARQGSGSAAAAAADGGAGSPPLLLSTPRWAPTLGLAVGAAHALLHLGLGEDVVLVPALRRARAFAVKRAAAESARRAAALAAAAAAALLSAGGTAAAGGAGSAPSLASAAVALLGAAVAAHALLVGAASVRAAFGERTQFVDSGGGASAPAPASSSSSSFRAAQAQRRSAGTAGAVACANDGLVASIVEAASRRDSSSSSPPTNSLEASLFDLAVRADAAALAEASAGSSGAWRRAALFADGVGVGSDGGGPGGGAAPPFPGAFPGRAWSAVVGGLCLSELAPALAAVGAALLPSAAAAAGAASTKGAASAAAAAAGVAGAASASGRGGGAAAAASATSPPRWNECAPAATAGAGTGGALSVFLAAAKRLASAAARLLSSSSSSFSKPPPPPSSSTTKPPAPLPPAVLKAKAAALLRQRWQHLALALRTLGALSAAAAEEDAAGVAQLAGGGKRRGGDGPGSPRPSFHPGTDLGSVLSALLSAAVAFGAAAEPGALPEWGTAAGGGGGGGGGGAALAPPGLAMLAAALEGEGEGLSRSRSRSSRYSSAPPLPRRDAAASALADAALSAAHRAVAAYGEDARRAALSAELGPCPVFGSGVSAAAVSALAEAVLAGRD